MARIETAGDRLVVTLEGWGQVWALKRRIEVPLASVRAATVNRDPDLKPHGFRAPGSYVPGVIAAGTYRKRGAKEFWSVRDALKAVVIDLAGAEYDQLVVQVPDPHATAAEIQRAIAA